MPQRPVVLAQDPLLMQKVGFNSSLLATLQKGMHTTTRKRSPGKRVQGDFHARTVSHLAANKSYTEPPAEASRFFVK